MRDRAVLDSGVIFALFFEDASERAMNAANEYSPITLDLAVAEVGNAAWKRVAFFGESVDAARLSLSKCLMFIKSCTTVNSSDLAGHAYEIALENRTTFYDSLFLAAAKLKDVPLLTLDKKCIWRQRKKQCADALEGIVSPFPLALPIVCYLS